MIKDRDLENQINVRLDDWTYKKIIGAHEKSGAWKGEIVRKCIMRCIRQDNAPKWKRWVLKMLNI